MWNTWSRSILVLAATFASIQHSRADGWVTTTCIFSTSEETPPASFTYSNCPGGAAFIQGENANVQITGSSVIVSMPQGQTAGEINIDALPALPPNSLPPYPSSAGVQFTVTPPPGGTIECYLPTKDSQGGISDTTNPYIVNAPANVVPPKPVTVTILTAASVIPTCIVDNNGGDYVFTNIAYLQSYASDDGLSLLPNPNPPASISFDPKRTFASQAVNNFSLDDATMAPNSTCAWSLGNFGQSPPPPPCSLDLVLGKSTVFSGVLTATGSDPNFLPTVANPQATGVNPLDITPIYLNLGSPTGDGTTQTQTIYLGQAATTNGYNFVFPSFLFDKPKKALFAVASGSGDLDGAYDYLDYGDFGNVTPATNLNANVRVRQTKPLGIVYSTLSLGLDFVDPSNFSADITESNALIQGMYPIADNGINWTPGPSFTASTISVATGKKLVTEDLDEIQFETLISNPGVQTAVAFVPASYFPTHGMPGVFGEAYQPAIGQGFHPVAAIVTDGYWSTTPHEVAHTFGVPHYYAAPLVNGYWPAQTEPVTNTPDLMDGGSSTYQYRFNPPARWISNVPGIYTVNTPVTAQNPFGFKTVTDPNYLGEYATIFDALLAPPAPDPTVMIIAGTITQDGQVALKPVYFLTNGSATPYDPAAPGMVSSINSDGSILAQSSFYTSFNLLGDDGSVIPVDSSFFAIQVPVATGPSKLQISYNGKVAASVNPNSELLIDAIKAIPDSTFIKDAKQERRRLLNRAERIESLLGACERITTTKNSDNWIRIACTDRVEEMVLALRRKVDKELNDSTVTSGPLQITKEQALGTVDYVELSLLGSPRIQALGHPVTIKVLPNDSKGILSLASVTQGQYGAVSVNPNGTVTYKPDSHKPEADSFTVTVEDAEGVSESVTVSIIAPCLEDRWLNRWAKRFDLTGVGLPESTDR